MRSEALLDAVLAIPSTASATNFYLEHSDSTGDFRTTAAERLDRLGAHLARVAGGELALVGEAPGWKGARQSRGAVHLRGGGRAPGHPRTNRAPTDAELDAGMDALRLAVAGRRVVCVGAQARRSVGFILGVEVPLAAAAAPEDVAVAIRHPANGGATRFRSELARVCALWALT